MKYIRPIIAIIASYIPGIIGLMVVPDQHSYWWHNVLQKPAVTAESWLIAIIWSIIYAILAFALYMIMENEKPFSDNTRKAFLLFGIHIVLNAVWHYVFFALHMLWASILVLSILIIVVFNMQSAFAEENKFAGWLIWPYIIWLLYAFSMIIAMVYMN